MSTYSKILKLDELLELQGGLESEADISNEQVTFITVHQSFELWFKLILRELVLARNILVGPCIRNQELANAVRGLRRAIIVYQQAAQQFSVIETLTTRDFLTFRDKLTSASGFQSAQMREIEILLGLDETSRVPEGRGWRAALQEADGSQSSASRRIEARLADLPTFRTALYDWLAQLPIDGRGQESVDDFLARYIECHRAAMERRIETVILPSTPPSEWPRLRERHANDHAIAKNFLMATDDPSADEATRAYRRRVRAAVVFLESYRELPRLTWARELVDSVVEFEQAMLIWRSRHVRMVERIIGRRTGTGGSTGVDYLDQTTRYRVFGDLWTTRTLLLPPESLPELRYADEYGFRRSRWSVPPPSAVGTNSPPIAEPNVPSDVESVLLQSLDDEPMPQLRDSE